MTTNTMTMKGKKLNRKEMVMTTDTMTMKEKKLKNIRKILWICFAGFSAPIILFTIPFFVILEIGGYMDDGIALGLPAWPFFIMAQVLTIGLIGGICLVIYHIFKYRIDRKDDNLFL